MKLKNTTTIPNEVVREIISFVKPSGIHNFDVMVKNSRHAYRGRAYAKGCSTYHSSADPFVVCAVGEESKFPCKLHFYQYGQLRGKSDYLANRNEALVYLMAHELRHIWQGKTKNKAGYYWGSRGRYSEIDTESYALHCLRNFRKVGGIAGPVEKNEPVAPIIVKSDEKLQQLLSSQKRWTSKLNRAESALKKIARKIKYYQNKNS